MRSYLRSKDKDYYKTGGTMKEIIVGKNEAGQRLDKLLKKYLRSEERRVGKECL